MGQKPFAIDDVESWLNEHNSDFLGTTEGKQLLEGVRSRMKDLNLIPKNAIESALNPATLEQTERLRQYLNDNWSPRTNRLVVGMKDAIDDSVTKQAGTDVYATSRALRQFRANAFDDPKGISGMLESPDGVPSNRAVQPEKIPQHVENMSIDQMHHFVGVLKQASVQDPALHASAVKSLSATRAVFANGVRAAGDSTAHFWNQKAVGQYLDRHGPKMAEVFTPAEMDRFKTLNTAGKILDIDKRYKGAAVQGNQNS